MPLSTDVGTKLFAPIENIFVEMPSFNVQEAILRSEQKTDKFKSLEFAHKFDLHLRPDNSGVTFTVGDMNVWRVGIRSKGAYSLNIIFSKFNLPEGAKLFVYNSNQTEILGSFTDKNNTDLNILPIQPIGGDELIVEYQEPFGSTFKGEIEIGEVNHDYIGIFSKSEPRDPVQSCHPNLICYPEDILSGSGVVLLIINGNIFCTGVMVNNSSEDGTPYLLTATHCLNNDFSPVFLSNRKYDIVAGNIVVFFNYNSPTCSTNIRGPIQMTMASTDSVLISERHDISLLRLKQAPPKEYQPYYLGWNSGSSHTSPFHGIHHPNGGIKKVAVANSSLAIGSFDPWYDMEPNSHWIVKAWDIGATEAGSSGSPLLDSGKRVVGTLTGGESYCSSPRGPDLYASLYKFWNAEDTLLNNPKPISFYLDPDSLGITEIDGFNPYSTEPYTKSHNFKSDEKPVESYFESTQMFATNNSFGYTEFAEEFNAKAGTKIAGIFISSPYTNNIEDMAIHIRVYTGDKEPERILYQLPLNYSYSYYQENQFTQKGRNMKYNVENWIRFYEPVNVSGTFYVSYYDANSASNGFTAFNAEPRKLGSGLISTAWMRNATGWVKSSENIENPLNTSLFIAPYVIGDANIEVKPDKKETNVVVYYSAEVKRIFIESNDDLYEWEIFYLSGQKVYHEIIDKSINRASFSAAHLAKGVYIVKAKTINGTLSSRKVLVT